jgi:hypothetical protein
MLRVPQHDRKIINDFKFSPFVLSHVEGLRVVFQQPARDSMIQIYFSGENASGPDSLLPARMAFASY